MQLAELNILQNVTPKWGAGHYLAQDKDGHLLEVLVAERSTESVTALLSWAKALEKVSHPSIPKIQMMVHQEITFVALKVDEGISLSNPLQHRREHLLRIDILSAFYQLATALKKLHDHGLNHGNLNLDHMKLIGEGQLQLRGWAPPAIETTFSLRQIDELKRFKNFFYLAIVGQFPPTHRHLQHSDQKLTPFQAQCLEAWSQWYHQEARKEQPNLSSSNLMLFDEVPQDASELIQELQPHLDHSFAQFYQQIENELADREKFETLYIKRQELLLELERVHRATQLWLQQQQHNKLISDQQTQNIDHIFGEVDLLRSQLEQQSGLFFNQSHQRLDQSSRLRNRNGNTQLYNIDPSVQQPSDERIQTFGRSMQDLEQAWHQVNPNQAIFVSDQDQNLILNSNMSASIQAGGESQNQLLNGDLIQWAELPPLVLDNHESSNSMDQNNPPSLRPTDLSSTNHSVLGIEPLPSYVDIPKVTASGDQHQTQLFMPDQYDYDDSSDEFKGKNSFLNLSSLIPARTKTVYTQHLPEFDSAYVYQSHETSGLKLAFSHRSFFIFLYFSAGLIFVWSLRNQDHASTTVKPKPSAESRLDTSLTPKANQASDIQDPKPSTSVNTASQSSSDSLAINAVSSPAKAQDSPQVQEAPLPIPPENMVYIPGGTVNDSLTDEAYNRVVAHCIFEPNYPGRDRRSKERCRYLIRRSKAEPQETKVSPFFMDKYEVSRGDYLNYCRSGGVCNQRVDYSDAELDLPVAQVSMIQAMDYCRFYKKHLPSYEQWLFAARGESTALYPWGDRPVLEAHEYRANYKSKLSKSKRKRKRKEIDGFRGPYKVHQNAELGQSPFGVVHMAGNVREWVSRDRRKLGWVTGGSWKQAIWHLRLTSGEFLKKYVDSSDDIGFRCAKKLD